MPMSRFQSKLFNWVDHSLPVVWGRQARRWVAELQTEIQKELNKQPNTTPNSKRQEIQQVLKLIQKLNRELSQTVLEIPRRLTGNPSNTESPQIGANLVGNFAESQPQLDPKHQLKLLSGAIATLVKIVRSIIRLKPNSNSLNKSNSDNLEEHWSDYAAEPEVDYWQEPKLNMASVSDALVNQSLNQTANQTPNQTKLEQFIQSNKDSSLEPLPSSLKTGESWWERMQRLLQEAIAYFLAKDAQIKKLPADPKSINLQNEAITKATSNKVIYSKSQSELSHLEDWYEDSFPQSVLNLQPQPSLKQMTATGALAQQTQAAISTALEREQKTQLTTIEEWATADLLELDDLSEASEDSLRAWIETQSVFLGYAYSPVMAVIHWCDRLVAKFESAIGSIYQAWLRFWQKLLNFFRNSNPPES
jgi:hypothetical protein